MAGESPSSRLRGVSRLAASRGSASSASTAPLPSGPLPSGPSTRVRPAAGPVGRWAASPLVRDACTARPARPGPAAVSPRDARRGRDSDVRFERHEGALSGAEDESSGGPAGWLWLEAKRSSPSAWAARRAWDPQGRRWVRRMDARRGVPPPRAAAWLGRKGAGTTDALGERSGPRRSPRHMPRSAGRAAWRPADSTRVAQQESASGGQARSDDCRTDRLRPLCSHPLGQAQWSARARESARTTHGTIPVPRSPKGAPCKRRVSRARGQLVGGASSLGEPRPADGGTRGPGRSRRFGGARRFAGLRLQGAAGRHPRLAGGPAKTPGRGARRPSPRLGNPSSLLTRCLELQGAALAGVWPQGTQSKPQASTEAFGGRRLVTSD